MQLKFEIQIQRTKGECVFAQQLFYFSAVFSPPQAASPHPVRVLDEAPLVAGDNRLETEVHHVVFNT